MCVVSVAAVNFYSLRCAGVNEFKSSFVIVGANHDSYMPYSPVPVSSCEKNKVACSQFILVYWFSLIKLVS